MAFSIKNPEADRLARQLAAAAGETLTEAVIHSLKERLQRHTTPAHRRIGDELASLAAKFATLPNQDTRTPDQILGYDEHGLPN